MRTQFLAVYWMLFGRSYQMRNLQPSQVNPAFFLKHLQLHLLASFADVLELKTKKALSALGQTLTWLYSTTKAKL